MSLLLSAQQMEPHTEASVFGLTRMRGDIPTTKLCRD
jgi:hypothetical protein